MNMISHFSTYEIIYHIGLKIEALLPLRIGGTQETTSATEPDLPIVKDSNGVPIIPGSSLKGFFRANSLRILGTLKESSSNPEQIIERVFGNTDTHASCLLFSDLSMDRSSGYIHTRKHVQIDAETGGVKRGPFDVECVSEGSTFTGLGIVGRNMSPSYLGLLYAVKRLTDDQVARFGGFKSRGYGAAKMSFESIHITLPAVSQTLLRSGSEIPLSIGFSPSIKIKASQNRSIVIEEGVSENSIVAEIHEEPIYFGCRLELEDLHAFLESMTSSLVTLLKSTGEEP